MSPRPLILLGVLLLLPSWAICLAAAQEPKLHVWQDPVRLEDRDVCVRYTDLLKGGDRVLIIHSPDCAPAKTAEGMFVISRRTDDQTDAACLMSPWKPASELKTHTQGSVTSRYTFSDYWFIAKNSFNPDGQTLSVKEKDNPTREGSGPTVFPDLFNLAEKTIGPCSRFVSSYGELTRHAADLPPAQPGQQGLVPPPGLSEADLQKLKTVLQDMASESMQDLSAKVDGVSKQLATVSKDRLGLSIARKWIKWIGGGYVLLLVLTILILIVVSVDFFWRARTQPDPNTLPKQGGTQRSDSFERLARSLIENWNARADNLMSDLAGQYEKSTLAATLAVSDRIAEQKEAVEEFLARLARESGVNLDTAREQARNGEVRSALISAETRLLGHLLPPDTKQTKGPDDLAQVLKPLLSEEIFQYLRHESNLVKDNKALHESIAKLEAEQSTAKNRHTAAIKVLMDRYLDIREVDDSTVRNYIVVLSKEPKRWRQCRETLRWLWLLLNWPESRELTEDWLRAAEIAEVSKALGDESPFLISDAQSEPDENQCLVSLKDYFCQRWTNLFFPIFRSDAVLRAYFPPESTGSTRSQVIPAALSATVIRLRALMQGVGLEPDRVELLRPPGPDQSSASQTGIRVPQDLTRHPEYAMAVSQAVENHGQAVAVSIHLWRVAGCDGHDRTELVVRDRP